MVTCNICFDEFIMESDEETAGSDLDISIALRCDTKNCKAIVCNGCEVKLQEQLKRNPIGIIKCPLCRQQYFKNHLQSFESESFKFNTHLIIRKLNLLNSRTFSKIFELGL